MSINLTVPSRRSWLTFTTALVVGFAVSYASVVSVPTVYARTFPCNPFSMHTFADFDSSHFFGRGQICAGGTARSWFDDADDNAAEAEFIQSTIRWIGTNDFFECPWPADAFRYSVKDEAQKSCRKCDKTDEVRLVDEGCDCACPAGEFIFKNAFNFNLARHRWKPFDLGRKTRFSSRSRSTAGCHALPNPENTNCWWTNVDSFGGGNVQCPVFCVCCNTGTPWGDCPGTQC